MRDFEESYPESIIYFMGFWNVNINYLEMHKINARTELHLPFLQWVEFVCVQFVQRVQFKIRANVLRSIVQSRNMPLFKRTNRRSMYWVLHNFCLIAFVCIAAVSNILSLLPISFFAEHRIPNYLILSCRIFLIWK